MKSSKKYWIIALVVFLFLCLGGAGFFVLLITMLPSSPLEDSWGDIAVVEIKGAIYESGPVTQKLEKYRKSSSIKAIVLRIDSPGGAVGPSQEIYTEVKKLAEKKKVVVSMGSVAASGGYYIAAPATKIYANPGTITGSIGVLMEHTELDELLRWAKIHSEILKAGELKDAGSALRKMKPEERAYLQGLLDNMHQQFIQAVFEGRKRLVPTLTLEQVRSLATGRVYTGEQAQKLGLVDELGNLEDALEEAKRLIGIKGKARIIWPRKPRQDMLNLLTSEERALQFLKKALSEMKSTQLLYEMKL